MQVNNHGREMNHVVAALKYKSQQPAFYTYAKAKPLLRPAALLWSKNFKGESNNNVFRKQYEKNESTPKNENRLMDKSYTLSEHSGESISPVSVVSV